MRGYTKAVDNNTLSGCGLLQIYCRRAEESAKAPPPSLRARIPMQKCRRSISCARARFRAPDSYFVRGTGLPSVRSAAPINRRRTRFAPRSPLRRDLLKDTCRADVSICNRKYLYPLCNSGAKRRDATRRGSATGAALIIPDFAFGASLLYNRLSARKLYDSSRLPPPGEIIPCPFVYINFAASSDASRPMLRGVLEKALRTCSHRTRSPFSLSSHVVLR